MRRSRKKEKEKQQKVRSGLAQVGGVAAFSLSVQVFPPTCAKPLAQKRTPQKTQKKVAALRQEIFYCFFN